MVPMVIMLTPRAVLSAIRRLASDEINRATAVFILVGLMMVVILPLSVAQLVPPRPAATSGSPGRSASRSLRNLAAAAGRSPTALVGLGFPTGAGLAGVVPGDQGGSATVALLGSGLVVGAGPWRRRPLEATSRCYSHRRRRSASRRSARCRW